jgi:hypothetical protein
MTGDVLGIGIELGGTELGIDVTPGVGLTAMVGVVGDGAARVGVGPPVAAAGDGDGDSAGEHAVAMRPITAPRNQRRHCARRAERSRSGFTCTPR